MKRFAVLLLLVSVSIASADPFVVIVRHGEKGTDSDKDPDLSSAGVARAEALASMLKDSGIAAIYATEFRRTQQTAAVTARSLNITPTIILANDTAALVTKLRELRTNALVVGHGNTIPDLVKALGVIEPVSISENDYNQILLITVGDKPQLFRLGYANDQLRFNRYNIKAQPSPSR